MIKVPNTTYEITKTRTGEIWGRRINRDQWKKLEVSPIIEQCVTMLRMRSLSDEEKKAKYMALFSGVMEAAIDAAYGEASSNEVSQSRKDAEEQCLLDQKRVSVAQNIMNFFSEFHFEPSFRFTNSLMVQASKGFASVVRYVANYFELIDSPYAGSVSQKIKSPEFKQIYTDLAYLFTKAARTINNRFKLYYGSQGTGKTYKAEREADFQIVCHSGMLPSDLIEDFQFDDGKPGFHKSALRIAMEEGKKISLDEINLLPFESLRFLQGILDGKEEFTYKGDTIHIKDGFQVIGTMNLVINGATFALPCPLVDRAASLDKFELTSDMLAAALA